MTCKHLQQHFQRHFQRKRVVKLRHWKLCLPGLVGSKSGFAVALDLGSNCFGGFKSEGKKGVIISIMAEL
jgi:hypothetical protein